MQPNIFKMLCRVRSVWCVLVAILLLSCGSHSAQAQWTVGNVSAIWNGFNNAFYNTDSSGRGYYYLQQGSSTEEFFWTFAEEIEMAEDAVVWEETNNPGNVAADKSRILNLANGFRHQHSDNWSSDPYNDDLSVAVLAFVRCWEVTGSAICLSDAETNYNTVYSRGYDTTLGGGLWWNNTRTGSQAIKGSSANWTFVIAGYLLYEATGDTSYKTKADTIYGWSKTHLYESSTGKVYNDEDYLGNINAGLVSYNFGLAIGAASFESDSTLTNNMANYLMANVYSATVNGYNILPDYGNSNNGFGAFNGMTFRWTAIANRKSGYMPSSFIPWAQQNLDLGWADRNAIAMSWDDWIPDPPASHSPVTPSTGLYSISCTPLPVGMFYIPVP